MRLTNLIQRGNKIIEGEHQLFIASEDFKFRGLPILKDALVHNDDGIVSVNKLSPLHRLDPSFNKFNGELTKEGRFYVVDKVSDCLLEETKLDPRVVGFWHNNHFDKTEDLSNYFHSRIQHNEPELEFNNINFSSIFYDFDIDKESLTYFINTLPIKINLEHTSILLPKHLEINRNKNSYTLVPITGMEYHGIYFNAGEGLILNPDGILGGYIGKGFKAEVLNLVTKNSSVIDFSNSRPYLKIRPDGSKFTRLFYPEIQERQECQILRIL